MSFDALRFAIDQELPTGKKMVLVVIADKINSNTGECFPSLATISRLSGMTKRSVISQIASLESDGYLTVTRIKQPDGFNIVNHYRINKGNFGVTLPDMGSELISPPSENNTLPSEMVSLGVVKPFHYPSEIISLGVVKSFHPNQELLTSNLTNKFNQDQKKENLLKNDKLQLSKFVEFWMQYPKKAAKADAEKAWLKLNPNEELANKITMTVIALQNSQNWADEKYIPHAATFLNGSRWEDEIRSKQQPERKRESFAERNQRAATIANGLKTVADRLNAQEQGCDDIPPTSGHIWGELV